FANYDKNIPFQIGYADGVNDGRESVFQKGFDQGYKDGLRTSFDLDKFRYFFKNLNTDKLENDNELIKEKDEYNKLHILESKSQQHFKYLDHPEENLDIISEKQQQYVNEIMQTFSNTLPKANDLLKKL
ncbi:hypothetical protein DOY81_009699, partial [Sarcophaga bullata]